MIIGGTSSQLRDIRLWKELIQGDDQALGQLMHLHYKALVNYGYKFVKDDEFVKEYPGYFYRSVEQPDARGRAGSCQSLLIRIPSPQNFPQPPQAQVN